MPNRSRAVQRRSAPADHSASRSARSSRLWRVRVHTTVTRGIRSPTSRNAACKKPEVERRVVGQQRPPLERATQLGQHFGQRRTGGEVVVGQAVDVRRGTRVVAPYDEAPGAGQVEPVTVDRHPAHRHHVVSTRHQPGRLDVEREQPRARGRHGDRSHEQQRVVNDHAVGAHRARPHQHDVVADAEPAAPGPERQRPLRQVGDPVARQEPTQVRQLGVQRHAVIMPAGSDTEALSPGGYEASGARAPSHLNHRAPHLNHRGAALRPGRSRQAAAAG